MTRGLKMRYKMQHLFLLGIFLMHVIHSNAVPCDSCGNECASACGTKNFRTCCFNYLRKRMDPNIVKHISNNRQLVNFSLLRGQVTQNELHNRPWLEKTILQLKELERNGTLTNISGLQNFYG